MRRSPESLGSFRCRGLWVCEGLVGLLAGVTCYFCQSLRVSASCFVKASVFVFMCIRADRHLCQAEWRQAHEEGSEMNEVTELDSICW